VTPEELVVAAGRAESCGDHTLAERLARAAVAAGAGFPAIRLLSRALVEQGRPAATPALRQLRPDVLTRREWEVAALAARGLSNRDIAALLVVSVRTVENQLHRVYAKLAVGGRDELASALAPRPEEAAPERR
jgi:DNA-binding NarL/FixJ family response regulator